MNHPVKRGRPTKPPEERRSELVQFKATPGEADVLYRNAVRTGLSLRDYLLRLVLRAESAGFSVFP